MESNNILFPGRGTFFDYQKKLLIPIIHELWQDQQAENLFEVQERDQVYIGGDARCDCVGLSAQYGSYTLMDLQTRKILDVQAIAVSHMICYVICGY